MCRHARGKEPGLSQPLPRLAAPGKRQGRTGRLPETYRAVAGLVSDRTVMA
ncbi:hypothetical protein SGPA1_41235 [Streptomyces misionensis JCM 4497]